MNERERECRWLHYIPKQWWWWWRWYLKKKKTAVWKEILYTCIDNRLTHLQVFFYDWMGYKMLHIKQSTRGDQNYINVKCIFMVKQNFKKLFKKTHTKISEKNKWKSFWGLATVFKALFISTINFGYPQNFWKFAEVFFENVFGLPASW